MLDAPRPFSRCNLSTKRPPNWLHISTPPSRVLRARHAEKIRFRAASSPFTVITTGPGDETGCWFWRGSVRHHASELGTARRNRAVIVLAVFEIDAAHPGLIAAIAAVTVFAERFRIS